MAATAVFRGASTHTLDDKARLIVPKRILDRLPALDTSFVLTAGQDKCLLLMSRADFDNRAGESEVDPLGGDPVSRSKLRRFLGHAEDVRPDKSGRIVISASLRHYMGLSEEDKEVVVVGMGGLIELWSATSWRESMHDPFVGSSLSDDESVGSKGTAPQS